MARCDNCQTFILFGGVKDGNYRFCSEKCHEQGYLLSIADQVPDDLLAERLATIHQGTCPKCGREGPVDVHTSHTVWSVLVMTSWKSNPEVCCRSCGTKAKLSAACFSGAFGWWGIPWGIFMTPTQIFRNVAGLASGPDPSTPSKQLETMVRIDTAARLVHANQAQAAAEDVQPLD